MPTSPVLELEGVRVVHGRHVALHAADLRVHAGALVGLAGPNGAGKSTLLEAAAGVVPLAKGCVIRASRAVALVPQRTAVPERLPVTVHDVVVMGAWGGAGPWRRLGGERRQHVRDAIEAVGLTALARRPFSALSGGERQRALLAQGLARRADLLVLDEPTTGLDVASAARVTEVLDRELARGVAVLCASHDVTLLRRADRVVRLGSGRVVGDGPGSAYDPGHS